MLERYGLVPASEMAPALTGAARGIPLRDRNGWVVAYTNEEDAAAAAAACRKRHMPFTTN